MCNNHKRSSDNPCTPKASNSPTNYKYNRIRCNATDEASEFKGSHGTKERPLDIEECEYSAIGWLQGAGGDEVCAAVPANVGVGVKFISNTRNSLEVQY